jgi:hypothetical protein
MTSWWRKVDARCPTRVAFVPYHHYRRRPTVFSLGRPGRLWDKTTARLCSQATSTDILSRRKGPCELLTFKLYRPPQSQNLTDVPYLTFRNENISCLLLYFTACVASTLLECHVRKWMLSDTEGTYTIYRYVSWCRRRGAEVRKYESKW